ncbi:MAG: cytochrome ubiquinol oxidase subunit I [Gaiellaceae bacterium]
MIAHLGLALASASAGGSAFPPVDQHYLFEARQLQALSLAVHIPLVCFGVAFPALVLFSEWLSLRTGDEVYRTLARRWSKVMLALFAVGVVTGTILSFELGMLWPNFMATFGSVFGLGFTLEGVSFFLEAIFISIYVYGWGRFSPRAHLLSGVPVAITGISGSFMVIAVNAWMNHPTGFVLRNGEPVGVHPWRALFANSYLPHEIVHMYLAAYIVAGFLTASVYAWGWLRGRRGRYERAALVIPLAAAGLAAIVQIPVGDWSARDVAKTQPVKLAAIEGLQRTTHGAAETLGGWYRDGHVVYGLRIPRMLSLLAYHDPNATVTGLDTVPPAQRPPVNVVRLPFQIMVGIGTLLALIGVAQLYVWIRKRRLPESRLFFWAVVLAGPLSLVALICGWIVTEVGRQPWIVYELMRTNEAVTGARGIPVGYGTLVVVYLVLAAAVVWILRRLAHSPLETHPAAVADHDAR